jgi:hypothetical protein
LAIPIGRLSLASILSVAVSRLSLTSILSIAIGRLPLSSILLSLSLVVLGPLGLPRRGGTFGLLFRRLVGRGLLLILASIGFLFLLCDGGAGKQKRYASQQGRKETRVHHFRLLE